MASHAQIIATIGPASETLETVERMLAAGMNVCRLNFSHGTFETNGLYIQHAKDAARNANKRIPIIVDLSGPRETTSAGHAFDCNSAAITDKDRADLDFALPHGIDYIAQSFIGCAEEVAAMRGEIEKRGYKTPIIAKIERREAIEDFDRILAASDAIMVARGDLGSAIPIEDIPFVERDLIGRANAAGKPVIVATQMLLSMTQNDTPTRAEVTDVAYAIVAGADAIMLSEESAAGKFPVEAVATMNRIAARAERSIEDSTVHEL